MHKLSKLSIALIVATSLAACANVQDNKPVQRIPQAITLLPQQLLDPCEIPDVPLVTYGDLAVGFGELRRALLLCHFKHQKIAEVISTIKATNVMNKGEPPTAK